MYEEILKNKDYLEVVNKIENIKFITDGKWDWEHGLNHYKRVANYIQKILTQLNADQRTIELGMAAALLHDIGLSESGTDKTDRGIISSKMFIKFITSDITKDEKKIIEHAIADHSKGNDIKSIIDLSLVLADKLDVTYHRTENSSIQDEINKEVQKIRSVDIEISENKLTVSYSVVGNFDINILKNWDKAITIPKKIANYLNKEYIFYVNDRRIDLNAYNL